MDSKNCSVKGLYKYLDPVVLDQAKINSGAKTEKEFAQALGISHDTLRKLRKRERMPSLDTLVAVADLANSPWEKAIIFTAVPTPVPLRIGDK